MLEKPASVAADAFKSAKWDEIAREGAFGPSDAPALALLCQWHKVAQQAMDELDSLGGNTAYTSEMGDLKAFPQIGTLKVASGEIRQLNKQLGISERREEPKKKPSDKANLLKIAFENRSRKASSAS
ncbi:MAG: hypothetical protein Q4B35_06495 [Slackia sp.]|nr:hypothetical protein [Slackia sp.]